MRNGLHERSRRAVTEGVIAFAAAVIAIGASPWLVSCKAQEPPGATYNRPSRDDLFESTLVLTEHDDARLLSAMREAVPSEGTVLAPARYGIRWADVQDAVRWGSNVAEMAVLTSRLEGGDTWVFEIITVADDPVTLRVKHVAPPQVLELRAVAGLFDDRRDLEERLIREVNAALRMFGAKARPVEFDEPAPPSDSAPGRA